MVRQLDLTDMDQAAQVHRLAFDHALPWLTGLHTPGEDRWFYRERMFKACTLWGAFHGEAMTGIIAFRNDWIDQLYVLPDAQRCGVGSELLQVGKGASDRLQLWTPAQHPRTALLRSARFCADRRNRRRRKRRERA
jgi:GNAT superfamily N-acetyltransferase